MSNLSDKDCLPALIDEIWKLYQGTDNVAQKAALTEQFQELTQQLASLADLVPQKTKEQYREAVTAVQGATRRVREAQQDGEKVASAVQQIAAVITAIAKLTTTA